MSTPSDSTISWLDSSEQERRTVLELVSALSEPGTLDELGIGRIRDTISEALFPGTSTIQTRARYFLFIPWISEDGRGETVFQPRRSGAAPADDALRRPGQGTRPESGCDRTRGGRHTSQMARLDLLAGPRALGNQAVPGIRPVLLRGAPPSALVDVQGGHGADEPVEEGSYETAQRARSYWAPMPDRPKDFPESVTFDLTSDEAGFLRDRVGFTHGSSFLAHLLHPEDERRSCKILRFRVGTPGCPDGAAIGPVLAARRQALQPCPQGCSHSSIT